MNKTSGPTPEWFGKPEPPQRSGSSTGAIVIAVVMTFVVTVVLCGLSGLAIFHSWKRELEVSSMLCEAQQAEQERRAADQLARAKQDCDRKLARAHQQCAEPRVRADAVEDTGDASTREFLAVVKASRAKFRACFNEVLPTSPNAHGKVTIQLDLSPNGRVDDVKLIGSTLPPGMVDCLKDKASALRFPSSDAKKTVRVPLIFVAQ